LVFGGSINSQKRTSERTIRGGISKALGSGKPLFPQIPISNTLAWLEKDRKERNSLINGKAAAKGCTVVYSELLQVQVLPPALIKKNMKKENKYGCIVSEDVCLKHDSPLISFGFCEDSPDIKEYFQKKYQQFQQLVEEAVGSYKPIVKQSIGGFDYDSERRGYNAAKAEIREALKERGLIK